MLILAETGPLELLMGGVIAIAGMVATFTGILLKEKLTNDNEAKAFKRNNRKAHRDEMSELFCESIAIGTKLKIIQQVNKKLEAEGKKEQEIDNELLDRGSLMVARLRLNVGTELGTLWSLWKNSENPDESAQNLELFEDAIHKYLDSIYEAPKPK